MDIASMLEVQVNEVNEPILKENVTPRATFSRARSPILKPYSQEENNYFKMMYGPDISSVRFSRIHCTACDVHIGSAPSQATNMFEHPKLRTLLCLRCYEFYGDGDFEQGDDQTDMFCRWCANGGNLYCCSDCSNTFCSKCVKRNFDAVIAKKIEDDEKWRCFVCDETDLYAARALCRAIIQHVQTVCRILQNDKIMSPAEVDEKMNLDESRCCIRKRKRKRRKTGSGSEDDDDETYNPLISEMPLAKRRRTRKSGQFTGNHTNGSANQSDDEGSLAGVDDLLPSMIPFEQTMTEGETALPFGSAAKIPNPVSRAVVAPPQQILGNNIQKNPVSTLNLLKPMKVRRLTPIAPVQAPRPILIQKRTNRPMVSIPQSQSPQNQQKKARVMLPKPRSAKTSTTPSVIDLESDSDEAIQVIEEAQKQNDANKKQTSAEINKTFEQMVLSQKHDIDSELQTLRRKFNSILFETPSKAQSLTDRETTLKMKQFQQVMRKTLNRLAQINDRVVREYHSWKKQTPETEITEKTPVNLLPTKKPDISLEMTCTRDSESENDDDNNIEDSILEASNFDENQLNCYNSLTIFRKKQTVDQAVGDYCLKQEDKAVQVYDVRTRDYEKSIGYSLLMKAEYDPKTEKEVLKPVEMINEHFGKFQEQYYYHLQHIEEHGIKTTEDLENLPDPNETPLKDLIEVNSPFIAEMLENIPPAVTNGTPMETETVKETTLDNDNNKNCEDEIREDIHVDSTKAMEELQKMVTQLSDELKSSNNSPENTALSSAQDIADLNDDDDVDDQLNNKEITKLPEDDKDETVLAVRTLIEEEHENSSDTNFNKTQTETGAIEECNFLN